MVESVEARIQHGARATWNCCRKRSTSRKPKSNDLAEKLVQYHILQHDAESNKAALRRPAAEAERSDASPPDCARDNIRVVDPALAAGWPVAAAEGAQHFAGVSGRAGRRHRPRAIPRISRQHREIAGRHRSADRIAFARRRAVACRDCAAAQRPVLAARSRSGAAIGWTGPRVELLSYMQPKSQISEAFRALRTSLLLSQADHPPQVILVTSALPREGKTTAAVNLAVTLAQLGDRTLLMDSDLRKPGIRRALNLTERQRSRAEFVSRGRFDAG